MVKYVYMNKKGMKIKGFTLIELIIVIIIVGILASLGVTQYAKVVEKGREAEARTVLGTLRTQQNAYHLENGVYFDSSQIDPSIPLTCQPTHYFYYTCNSGGTGGRCSAYRCTGANGKQPGYDGILYHISLTADGRWSRGTGTPSP
ncbi:MAG: prepilin-type N-terminal cleavage/methylation domain-containing protein [Candidatus Omnitrophota bacterium]